MNNRVYVVARPPANATAG